MSEITRRDLLRTGLALPAGPLLVKRSDAQVMPSLAAGSADQPSPALLPASPHSMGPRERLLFDFGWKLHLGDPPGLRNLGSRHGLSAFSVTGTFGFATETFDASSWRTLDLPHDWAVELPFKFSISGAGRFRGVGNGDPNCQESDQQPMRSLFNGLAQLIVQSGREPGVISIEAQSGPYNGPSLALTKITVKALEVDPRPAVA